MRLRLLGLSVLAFGLFVLGCRATPGTRGAGGANASVSTTISTGPPDLCLNRIGCVTSRVQTSPAAPDLTLIVLTLANPADAASDEERCDRREYWVARPSGVVLLATDCQTQWGADNPGPATVRFDGTAIDLQYTEFQSNDRCERYEARILVEGARISANQRRKHGVVSKDACHLDGEWIPMKGTGKGTIGDPVLTLHQ